MLQRAPETLGRYGRELCSRIPRSCRGVGSLGVLGVDAIDELNTLDKSAQLFVSIESPPALLSAERELENHQERRVA